jgi:hypothetical protein
MREIFPTATLPANSRLAILLASDSPVRARKTSLVGRAAADAKLDLPSL